MSSIENSISVKDVKETILSLKKLAEEKSDENNFKIDDLEKLTTQRMEVKVELKSLHKRTESLEDEYNVSNQNLELIQSQIDNLGKLADEDERWRKEYERKQVESDERMEEMSSIIKAAQASAEGASNKYDEAVERLQHTNTSITQLEKKITAVKKVINQREKDVKEKATTYKKLQYKSEERVDNESKKEEYIDFLRKQVDEAETRAQKSEADVFQKKTQIDRLQNRLKLENDRVGSLKKDMNSIYSEFKKL